jgi:thiosulfate/3-mercaptopyruvate sulfurtransferase
MENAMKLACTAALAAFLAAGSNAATPCGGHGTRDTMLVSTAWLAQHLHDPNLVVLSVGDKGQYDEGHIPGALYLDYMDTHYMQSPAGLTLELLPMADLVKNFEKLGITNDSRIILCWTKNQYSPTTRVFWTIDAMGLAAQASILDGGFPLWKSEGRSASTEVRSVAPGKLMPCAQDDTITDAAYVRANLNRSGVRIVDARDPEYYTGAKAGSGKRPGHIPGAANITYSTLFDDQGRFKKPDVLAEMFHSAGIRTGDRVVSYCHIGQQATVVYFAARYLGYDARLYDGSWEDWSAHPEYPAETSSAKR